MGVPVELFFVETLRLEEVGGLPEDVSQCSSEEVECGERCEGSEGGRVPAEGVGEHGGKDVDVDRGYLVVVVEDEGVAPHDNSPAKRTIGVEEYHLEEDLRGGKEIKKEEGAEDGEVAKVEHEIVPTLLVEDFESREEQDGHDGRVPNPESLGQICKKILANTDVHHS